MVSAHRWLPVFPQRFARSRIGLETDHLFIQRRIIGRTFVTNADIRERALAVRDAIVDVAENERRRLHVPHQQPIGESHHADDVGEILLLQRRTRIGRFRHAGAFVDQSFELLQRQLRFRRIPSTADIALRRARGRFLQ
jgi:hypothetical protein